MSRRGTSIRSRLSIMTGHRAHAQFDRAKWRLRLLAPCWAMQLILSMGMMGLFGRRLGSTVHNFDDRNKAGKAPVIEFVWEATNIAMSFIIAICTFFEVARYFAESLTPWTMLFTHVVKLTCASAILALDVVIYVQRSDAHYSLVGLGMDALLIITAISLAIYAIITYRRLSKYDDYAFPVSVKSYGFHDGLDRDSSSSGRPVSGYSTYQRGSGGSITNDTTFLQPTEQTPRRYSHERDTRFEEYLIRKATVKSKVDSGQSSPPGEKPRNSIGNVTSRSRGSSMSRAMGYGNDHALVAVPEEEGDVDIAKHGRADQEALLEHDSQEQRLSRGVEPRVAEPRWRRD